MRNDLRMQLEEVEMLVLKVKGFAGIGIVNYGVGDRIEVAADDEAALQRIRAVLHESKFRNEPILTTITGKTTFL